MEDNIINPAELPQQVLQPDTGHPWYKNGKVITTLLVIAILVAAGAGYVFWKKPAPANPTSNNVKLTITGPDQVAANTEAEFHIVYKNDEDADLTQVHLDMIYPSNFQFKSSTPAAKSAAGLGFDLPVLRKGKSADVYIHAKLSGATGEQKVITAKLSYQLSNFNSTFGVNQTFATTIAAPNLTFDLTGPTQVPSGQDVTFTANYANVSGSDYDNMALQLAYPDGFKFTKASVNPAKGNNYWIIGKLPQGSSGHIDITGSFVGGGVDEQVLVGNLGQVISNNFASQISSTATFQISAGPITITQSASPSDVVNPGDSVQVTINYENSGNIGLTNLIITDTINSNLVDLSHLAVPEATITGSTITWKAATNPDLSILSPGKSGQVQFSLPIKSTITSTLKNQSLVNSVSVVSSEVTLPIRAPDVTLQLASGINFTVSGKFVAGSNPLKLGKSTTVLVTFTITDSSNDLNSTEVVASLPLPSSDWNNVVFPAAQQPNLSFDPSSGVIRWSVGNLPAYTGKLTPPLSVSFQLVLKPSASDQNQTMRLITSAQASALDSYTGLKVQSDPVSQFGTGDIPDFFSTGGVVQ